MTQRQPTILLNVAICVTVIAAGGGIFAGLAALKKDPETKEPPRQVFNVTVFQVEATDLREIISGFGTVVADQEVEYSAQVGGEIVEISPLLKVGMRVDASPKSGSERLDPLLRIDPEVYVEQQTQAENALAEAEAQENLLAGKKANNARLVKQAEQDDKDARSEYDRAKANFELKTISESALTQARLEFNRYHNALLTLQNEATLFPAQEEMLKQQILSLNTKIKLASIEVGHTHVNAPFSGVLSEVHVEKGQLVQPGSPLFRVTNLDVVEIAVPLHALDAAKVHERLKTGEQPSVEIAVNETTQSIWIGRATRIAPRADKNARTIDVFVEVTNEPGATPLLPGMFVQARIEGPILKNAIAIPRDAVLGTHPERGRIFVVKEGVTKSRTVKIQRRLEGMAFVEKELSPGEQLLLTNLDVVKDGSNVIVQSQRSLSEELAGQTTLQPYSTPRADSPDAE
jgi:RND family efflux transporter MFP subunit